MRIGIDNYGLEPLQLSPLDLLDWALQNGAEGVAFSGLAGRPNKRYDSRFLSEIKSFAAQNDLYLEWGGGQHFGFSMNAFEPIEIFTMNKVVAQEAAELNCGIVRSCSGGLMRWNPNAPSTEEFLASTAHELKKIQPMLKDLQLTWALETHFEFTSFELLRLFEESRFYPGEGIGICLDTMNLLTMLEDPVEATERLAPWVVSTHIKDGGFAMGPNGLLSYPAALGQGKIDLMKIIAILERNNSALNLNVEDHNGSFSLPFDQDNFLSLFPDLTKETLEWVLQCSKVTPSELNELKENYMDREKWPSVCENRMKEGLLALKEMYIKKNAQQI